MKENKETKSISFRLPADVFDVLQNKGVEMNLSAHELASKIVQGNHQVPIEATVVKDTVTHSKQIFLPPPYKRAFEFNLKELKQIFYAITGGHDLPYHVEALKVGVNENIGLMRTGEDLWEIVVEHSYFQFHNTNVE